MGVATWVNPGYRGVMSGYTADLDMDLDLAQTPKVRDLQANRGGMALVAAVLLFGVLIGAGNAYGQAVEKGALGLGLIIGEPTGVSGKLYLSDDTALDAAVGAALVGGGIQIHGDFLWHPLVLEERDLFVLPAYIGAGGRVLDRNRSDTESDIHLGVRGVGGMLFDFKPIPIDVFVELAVVLDYVISSDTNSEGFGFDINAGAGVRYYF